MPDSATLWDLVSVYTQQPRMVSLTKQQEDKGRGQRMRSQQSVTQAPQERRG